MRIDLRLAIMSTNDDNEAQEFPGKKGRVQRACDVCRRRKTRCDGWQMPGDKCSTCIEANVRCTYYEARAKRPPQRGYVESLEKRLAEAEALVHQLRAEVAAMRNSLNASAGAGNGDSRAASLFLFMRTVLRSLAAPEQPPHVDDLVHLDLTRRLEKLHVDPSGRGFVGKSSGAMLVKAAIDLRDDVKREHTMNLTGEPSLDDFAHEQSEEEDAGASPSWSSRRLQYWTWKPNTAHRTNTYSFPTDLHLGELVELYFTHQNMYVPLLHRPTFERNIAEGLHLRSDGFAITVLLVCAIGSRWSADPSVTRVDLSCGWEWFDQVSLVGNHLFGQASLYDLQYYSLAAQFLDGSSAPQACWNLVGLGLRAAQHIGCHRRTARIEVPSVERELYKRAFWVLVYQDRAMSSNMGRICAIQYEDFDIDLPIECDDEYWEHPTHPFQQPANIPSRVAFFNTLIRLQHILAWSLKILYGLNKVRVLFMVEDGWEENAVAELDSALNYWYDNVPEHLRWDSARENPVFFDQSVALHCGYHHLQILIHRPFIPMLRKSESAVGLSPLSCLAICTNAARSIANMVDIQRRRKDSVPLVINLPAVFTSGIILLLNVWSGKRTGLVSDTNRDMVNVHKCMEVMRFYENRWQSAGSLWDVLAELASVGRLPLPNAPSKRTGSEQQSDIGSTSTVNTSQGSRNPHEAFGRPIHDPRFRAPYVTMPQAASLAGAIGGDYETFGRAAMAPSTFAPTPAPETWFPADDPYAQMDPAQASRELADMMNLIDNDTIAMWTNAPMGMEVDDWGNYFSSFGELTQESDYHRLITPASLSEGSRTDATRL
ncbi:fungal-specific transcription factor domain-containing protein [Mycena polygramma]|nr:fungal-specific transcription factor domain-containing protein [Mycena polygramma]